jgi:hypothetical protein
MNEGRGTEAFAAYTDESGCFNRNHQSIGVVSGRAANVKRLREDLVGVLAKAKIKEIKFELVRTHSPILQAAHGFIDKALEYVSDNIINIDVLCWWTKDTRHDIHGRDDFGNLARMYYKILRNVSEKWHVHNWAIFPDKGSKLNWGEVVGYLNKTRLVRKPYIMTLFLQDNFTLNFRGVISQDSIDEPLVQLADLFAGMACFSVGQRDLCKVWMRKKHLNSNPTLFSENADEKIALASSNRFDLLYSTYKHAKKSKLGVSFEREGYIRSYSKTMPLNFWYYRPMNSKDKAPTRNLR